MLSSLFSAENPFRRKPDQDPPPPSSKVASQLSGLELSSASDAEEQGNSKKRKKKSKKLPLLEENRKRKKKKTDVSDDKEEEEEEERVRSPKKKRKRKEIEKEAEMLRRPDGGDEMEEENGEEEVGVGRKRKADELEGRKDMVVGKEVVYDDEAKLLRTVFVGNLPLKTKKKELLKEFSGAGDVESIRIRSVPILESKEPRMTSVIKGHVKDDVDRVNAYIVFKDEKSAQAALSHNMKMIGGNHIRVDKACPPRKKMKGGGPIYSVKKTIFVGNLPYDVKDEEVYQLFCEDSQLESSLEAVRVIRDPQTNKGKGIAYVLFKTREAANKVVKKQLKLRDRALRLSHAKPDAVLPSKASAPLKRKHPGSEQQEYTKVKADSLSYQGMRSSKSGPPKKMAKGAERLHSQAKGRTEPMREKKTRSTKRPAVAARKANSLKQAERKRKIDDGTPEITHKNKKPRHFK